MTPALARVRTFQDEVTQIATQGSVEEVLFKYRAAFYYLKHDQANFNEARRALLASQLQKKKIRFVVDTDTMEIKEVLP